MICYHIWIMEDLLLRSAIIITPETMRNNIFTKEDKDLIFLHKKHIIKNLYKKSPLFKHTIENFDKVEQYYFIVQNIYRDYDRKFEIQMGMSIYLEDYEYLLNLMTEFSDKQSEDDGSNDVDIEYNGVFVSSERKRIPFDIGRLSYMVDKFSINIEWFNMSEDAKLDAFYRFNNDDDDGKYSFNFNDRNTFSIVLKNYEKDVLTPADRKKINIPLNKGNGGRMFKHYKKSFIKNDPAFYDKYKLILDE